MFCHMKGFNRIFFFFQKNMGQAPPGGMSEGAEKTNMSVYAYSLKTQESKMQAYFMGVVYSNGRCKMQPRCQCMQTSTPI